MAPPPRPPLSPPPSHHPNTPPPPPPHHLQTLDYNETAQTRTELRALKDVWDFKANVNYTHASWRTALWSEVETDKLEEENKGLLKLLRYAPLNPLVAW